MIPLFLVIRFWPWGPRLWLPIFLVWLLLLPFVLLLLPVAVMLSLIFGINPIQLVVVPWNILAATRGTHIEIEDPHTRILIHIV